MTEKKDKVGVEIEVGGHEYEFEIDPTTGRIRVEGDDEEVLDLAPEEEEEPAPRRRGGRLWLGLLLGGLAGALAGSAVVRQLVGRSPAEGAQTPQNGQGGGSDAILGPVLGRWQEATQEGRIAARDAEQRSRARYRELTEEGR